MKPKEAFLCGIKGTGKTVTEARALVEGALSTFLVNYRDPEVWRWGPVIGLLWTDFNDVTLSSEWRYRVIDTREEMKDPRYRPSSVSSAGDYSQILRCVKLWAAQILFDPKVEENDPHKVLEGAPGEAVYEFKSWCRWQRRYCALRHENPHWSDEQIRSRIHKEDLANPPRILV